MSTCFLLFFITLIIFHYNWNYKNYYIQKLTKNIKENIKKISFGIITTYRALNDRKKYSNFAKICEFCFNNKYEFILFDTDNNNIYINESKAINDYTKFKKIKSIEDISTELTFIYKSIFKDNVEIPQTMLFTVYNKPWNKSPQEITAPLLG